MYYSIVHTTAFRYSAMIRENVMELQMQPRSDAGQNCFSFAVRLDPKAALSSYKDYLGNIVHTFNVPTAHDRLVVIAESLVEIKPPVPVPQSLDSATWQAIDEAVSSADLFEMLLPSAFAEPTQLLVELKEKLDIRRLDDPITTIRDIGHKLYNNFEYTPNSTKVDSPIDHILETGKGVCQDYAHVMIALARLVGIPCRYVSGYLHQRHENGNRTAREATHAWIEAWMPGLGWVGFDPTNDTLASERHIRVALGRDYSDVPPTRGVYKGKVETKLEVSVVVKQLEALPMDEGLLPVSYSPVEPPAVDFAPKAAPATDNPPQRVIEIAQQQQQQ
jgi:transglutaminase-like putative cysteine protease